MDKGNSSKSDDNESANTECTICLQSCVQPIRLPCKHVFCFLCAKGLTVQNNNKCALCRKEIPYNYMKNPHFIVQVPSGSKSACYKWYYQGQQGGWWQYDYQTSGQIEHSYQNDEEQCELLIAGQMYIIDFKVNKQIQKSNPFRTRLIKRDLDTITSKGVAGVPTSLCDKALFQKNDEASKSAFPEKSDEELNNSDSDNCIIALSDHEDSENDVKALKRTWKESEEQNKNEDASGNLPESTKRKKCKYCTQQKNSFGALTMSKLQKMSPAQRLIAEKIIEETLLYGKLGKLSENSCISHLCD